MISLFQKDRLPRQEIIRQWLELYPLHRLDYVRQEDELIVVLVPHSQNWFTRRFLPTTRQPAQRIHLDEIGSFVWRHFDGKHSLREISQLAEEKFSEKVQPAEERLVLFAQQMYKQKFISMFKHQFNEPSSPRK